MDILAHNTEV